LRVTGFIIDGYSPAMKEEVWDAYARFSPGGIGGQKMARQGIYKGMPFIRVADASQSPEEVAAGLAATISPEQRSFFYLRTILKTASWHAQVQELLAKAEPCARVVDPHTFFALLARYERDKARYPRPSWPKPAVRWTPDSADGLRLFPFADGPFAMETLAGRAAAVARAEGAIRYLYAAVHDGFGSGRPETLVARVTYLDTPGGRFTIHYNRPAEPYASGAWITLAGSGQWKEAAIVLKDAFFANEQNGGADLRFCIAGGVLAVARIAIEPDPRL